MERELAGVPQDPEPNWQRLGALLAGALIISLLLMAACQPQERPDMDRSEVRDMVQEEVQSPWTVEQLEEIASRETIVPLIEEVLDSPEMEQLLQDKLIELVESPAVQMELAEALEELIETPQAQERLQAAVRRALAELLGQGMNGNGGGQDGDA